MRAKKPGKAKALVKAADAAKEAAPPPANDDRKSAIVTARTPGKAVKTIPAGGLPDTPEEHQRVGDLADATFQEMKRRIVEKVR